MAEINSRQITGLTTSPKTKVAPYDDAQIRVFVATTPAAAAWAQNDTFKICDVPKGTRILSSSKVKHGAFGASVTMDVGTRQTSDGTVLDADGLAAALNVAAAGTKEISGGAQLQPAGFICTVDTTIYATLAAANPTDDAQAEFEIHLLLPTP
jgi:hypothetical protein